MQKTTFTSKVSPALGLAVNHLGGALEHYAQKDFEKAEVEVWYASSEVEYALFLLELDCTSTYEPADDALGEKLDFEFAILKVQGLLKETIKNLETGKTENVLRTLWLARRILILTQREIEKSELQNPDGTRKPHTQRLH
ncbi:MAG: hypothetical protein QXJ75_00170 [Candidatus Bathyarchaeia archaeon]